MNSNGTCSPHVTNGVVIHIIFPRESKLFLFYLILQEFNVLGILLLASTSGRKKEEKRLRGSCKKRKGWSELRPVKRFASRCIPVMQYSLLGCFIHCLIIDNHYERGLSIEKSFYSSHRNCHSSLVRNKLKEQLRQNKCTYMFSNLESEHSSHSLLFNSFLCALSSLCSVPLRLGSIYLLIFRIKTLINVGE